MKNVEESDVLGKELTGKAIIVGWDPGRQDRNPEEMPWDPEDSLDELEALCDSLGVKVKYRVLQAWRKDRGNNLPIGRGKVEELRQQVKYDPEIGIVIFDKDLTFRALLSLKGRIDPDGDIVLLDRTSLILRIFAARARTPEAKLQVSLASQQYMLPRLRYYLTTGGGLEGRGGSVAGGGGSGGTAALRGAGETQLNKDKSTLQKQMSRTRKKLEDVRKHRAELRKNSEELGLPVIALVGYTNAGKSSLLNRLCGSNEVVTKNRLFETLDPTRRRVRLEGGREVVLSDTVGFVQRLPEQLVEGFRATLEETSEAAIVLHVVDTSSPTVAEQIGTVQRTLKDLKEFDVETPQLLVFNKVDKLEDGIPDELKQSLFFPWPGVVGHVQISALTGFGLQNLADAIEDTIVKHTSYGAKRMNLLLPYTEAGLYAKLRGPPPMAKINSEEATNDGWLIDVTASESAARQLGRFEAPQLMLDGAPDQGIAA